ncbi:hypothetical protein GCM10010358_21540 [Streptomyces minutiscleroticus]|uniref:Uncharacterized protein n=1 Tax=Streptomyces minutiscleroticus TaxID=68238 RepID=A0A918KLX9_9ACTN|nr:hypothetical protein GCM10010358_21540 [Streptomyces minutiscleroticus]
MLLRPHALQTASDGPPVGGGSVSTCNARPFSTFLTCGSLAITHLAFYAGRPNAMSAITRLKGIAGERGA